MTSQLPAISDDEIRTTVTAWIATLHVRMSTQHARLYWCSQLADLVRQGHQEATEEVIRWADAGCDLSDAAIRQVLWEMEEATVQPPTSLRAYRGRVLRRGIIERGPGGSGWDHTLRNIGIAIVIQLAILNFGLKAAKACRIVSEVYGMFRLGDMKPGNAWAIWHRFDPILNLRIQYAD
jgi:hypothetical protein